MNSGNVLSYCADPTTFVREVVTPLFSGRPKFPYTLIYFDWAVYKNFLTGIGVRESQIPPSVTTENAVRLQATLTEIDFLIQIILAHVFRCIGQHLDETDIGSIRESQPRAIAVFVELAVKFFGLQKELGRSPGNQSPIRSFEELNDLIKSRHDQLLKGACQRLSFFYDHFSRAKTHADTRNLVFPIGTKPRAARPSPPSPGSDKPQAQTSDRTRAGKDIKPKEQVVDHLFSMIANNGRLQTLIDEVNIRSSSRSFRIKLSDRAKGIFVLGDDKVDLRDTFFRISEDIQPQARLLFRFLEAKMHPERPNTIEMDYEAGVGELEVSIMIDDGRYSENLRSLLRKFNESTTFLGAVSACAELLEEVLGTAVEIAFTASGDVVFEMVGLRELGSRNMAEEVVKEMEAIVNRKANIAEDVDFEQLELDKIADDIEAEIARIKERWDGLY